MFFYFPLDWSKHPVSDSFCVCVCVCVFGFCARKRHNPEKPVVLTWQTRSGCLVFKKVNPLPHYFHQLMKPGSAVCWWDCGTQWLILTLQFYISSFVRGSVNEPSWSETERCRSWVLPFGGNKTSPSGPRWSTQRICYTWKWVSEAAKYCGLEPGKGQIAIVSTVPLGRTIAPSN